MYVLMVFVLLSSGTWQSDSKEFPTQEACERSRVSVAFHASESPALWLVSRCARENDEPLVFNVFTGAEEGSFQKPQSQPLDPKDSA